jgi:putative membrane protein
MTIRALAIITALALPTAAIADDPNKTPPADKTADKATDKTNEKTTNAPTDKAPGKTDKSAKLSDGDVKIIAHLHHVNMMETEMGKLAQKNGTAAVKSYAETLVTDHQTNDKELMTFTKQRRLAAIPADKPQTDADRQDEKDMTAKMARLKTLKGAEFDKEFVNMMVAGHDKELAKIDTSIGAASDTDLQTMLKSVKPVLQRHADQARDLQKNSPQASADKPIDKLPSEASKPIDKLPSEASKPVEKPSPK